MNTLKTILVAIIITGVLFAIAVASLTRISRDAACEKKHTVMVDFDYKEIH